MDYYGIMVFIINATKIVPDVQISVLLFIITTLQPSNNFSFETGDI